MKYIIWLFAEKNTPVKVIFLLCTILFDFITIITYTTLGIAIPPIVFCILLFINIASTAGTILSLCFSVVPDVCGFEYKAVIRILKRERLKYSIICDDVIVIGQEPMAGRVVRKGSKIRLEVAKFIDNGVLRKENVAIDEISERTLYHCRTSLTMAGQAHSTNKRMIIERDDGTPNLYISRLVDGELESVEESDWKRIRTFLRFLVFDKEPLGAERYGKDGIEIIC